MLKIRLVRAALLITIMLPCSANPPLSNAATEVKLEDILSGYLASVGIPATRAAVRSRVVEGTTQFNVLTGGSGKATDGTAVIVSDGRKFQFMMKFAGNYHGERFICDGNKVSVATATDAQSRSNFGNFVYIQDVIMREGLLGGELSTAWPLLDLEQRKAKLSYDGLKTVDGRQLYEVRYKPKKGQDVEIRLYFDQESLHHVLTLYTLSVRSQLVQGGQLSGLAVPEMGGQSSPITETTSADAAQAGAQQETRYRVEERFGEFKTVDGLTLPNHYTIQFTQERQGGNTAILVWDTSATRILENITVNPRNFEVK